MDRSSGTGSRFFVAMAAVLLAIVFGGFARTFFLKAFFATPQLPWYLHLHGAVLTGWFVLFLTQTMLIANGRTAVHRRLGVALAVLAVLLALTTVHLIRGADAATAARGITRTQPIAMLVLGDFAALGSFLFLGSLGIVRRHQPAVHKRAMLLANVALVAPGLARLVRLTGLGSALFFPGVIVLLLAVWVHDLRSERRVHPATAWGSALILGSFLALGMLARSEAGTAFVTAISLPGG